MDLEEEKREAEKRLYKRLERTGQWFDIEDIVNTGEESGVLEFRMRDEEDVFNMGIQLQEVGNLDSFKELLEEVLGYALESYSLPDSVHFVVEQEDAQALMVVKARVEQILEFLNTGEVELEPMETEFLYAGVRVFSHSPEDIREKKELAVDDLMDALGFILLSRELIAPPSLEDPMTMTDKIQKEFLHMREPLGNLLDDFLVEKEKTKPMGVEQLELKFMHRFEELIKGEIEHQRGKNA
jgi:hypothetical protein